MSGKRSQSDIIDLVDDQEPPLKSAFRTAPVGEVPNTNQRRVSFKRQATLRVLLTPQHTSIPTPNTETEIKNEDSPLASIGFDESQISISGSTESGEDPFDLLLGPQSSRLISTPTQNHTIHDFLNCAISPSLMERSRAHFSDPISAPILGYNSVFTPHQGFGYSNEFDFSAPSSSNHHTPSNREVSATTSTFLLPCQRNLLPAPMLKESLNAEAQLPQDKETSTKSHRPIAADTLFDRPQPVTESSHQTQLSTIPVIPDVSHYQAFDGALQPSTGSLFQEQPNSNFPQSTASVPHLRLLREAFQDKPHELQTELGTKSSFDIRSQVPDERNTSACLQSSQSSPNSEAYVHFTTIPFNGEQPESTSLPAPLAEDQQQTSISKIHTRVIDLEQASDKHMANSSLESHSRINPDFMPKLPEAQPQEHITPLSYVSAGLRLEPNAAHPCFEVNFHDFVFAGSQYGVNQSETPENSSLNGLPNASQVSSMNIMREFHDTGFNDETMGDESIVSNGDPTPGGNIAVDPSSHYALASRNSPIDSFQLMDQHGTESTGMKTGRISALFGSCAQSDLPSQSYLSTTELPHIDGSGLKHTGLQTNDVEVKVDTGAVAAQHVLFSTEPPSANKGALGYAGLKTEEIQVIFNPYVQSGIEAQGPLFNNPAYSIDEAGLEENDSKTETFEAIVDPQSTVAAQHALFNIESLSADEDAIEHVGLRTGEIQVMFDPFAQPDVESQNLPFNNESHQMDSAALEDDGLKTGTHDTIVDPQSAVAAQHALFNTESLSAGEDAIENVGLRTGEIQGMFDPFAQPDVESQNLPFNNESHSIDGSKTGRIDAIVEPESPMSLNISHFNENHPIDEDAMETEDTVHSQFDVAPQTISVNTAQFVDGEVFENGGLQTGEIEIIFDPRVQSATVSQASSADIASQPMDESPSETDAIADPQSANASQSLSTNKLQSMDENELEVSDSNAEKIFATCDSSAQPIEESNLEHNGLRKGEVSFDPCIQPLDIRQSEVPIDSLALHQTPSATQSSGTAPALESNNHSSRRLFTPRLPFTSVLTKLRGQNIAAPRLSLALANKPSSFQTQRLSLPAIPISGSEPNVMRIVPFLKSIDVMASPPSACLQLPTFKQLPTEPPSVSQTIVRHLQQLNLDTLRQTINKSLNRSEAMSQKIAEVEQSINSGRNSFIFDFGYCCEDGKKAKKDKLMRNRAYFSRECYVIWSDIYHSQLLAYEKSLRALHDSVVLDYRLLKDTQQEAHAIREQAQARYDDLGKRQTFALLNLKSTEFTAQETIDNLKDSLSRLRQQVALKDAALKDVRLKSKQGESELQQRQMKRKVLTQELESIRGKIQAIPYVDPLKVSQAKEKYELLQKTSLWVPEPGILPLQIHLASTLTFTIPSTPIDPSTIQICCRQPPSQDNSMLLHFICCFTTRLALGISFKEFFRQVGRFWFRIRSMTTQVRYLQREHQIQLIRLNDGYKVQVKFAKVQCTLPSCLVVSFDISTSILNSSTPSALLSSSVMQHYGPPHHQPQVEKILRSASPQSTLADVCRTIKAFIETADSLVPDMGGII